MGGNLYADRDRPARPRAGINGALIAPNLPGAITSSFSITGTQPLDAGPYDVIARDFSGSTSAVTVLTVTGHPEPPSITTQPQSQLINPARRHVHAVRTATGSLPLSASMAFFRHEPVRGDERDFTHTNAHN